MGDWRQDALAEIAALKPHWVRKHGWRPQAVERDEAIDLYIELRGKAMGEREYVLRLRYLLDWEVAGRRETFVNPDDREQEGVEFWPPEGIRGVNPQHRINGSGPVVPCICLRGAWGYHSVLHANESAEGSRLLNLLIELQEVIDE